MSHRHSTKEYLTEHMYCIADKDYGYIYIENQFSVDNSNEHKPLNHTKFVIPKYILRYIFGFLAEGWTIVKISRIKQDPCGQTNDVSSDPTT